MKIDQLIYFAETARLEHIGKASKILGISTSAISHSIAALEGELGYDLFEKKGKNIVLTDQGKILLNKSQDLINQFQNLKQSLLSANNSKMYFRLAVSHHLSWKLVSRAWCGLCDRYPLVTVEIMTYRSAEVIKSVLNREVDFGLCFSPQEHPDLDAKILYQGELFFSVRKNHPILKLKNEQRIKELSNYNAVLPKAYQGVEVCQNHTMFKQYDVALNVQTLTDSYDISLEMIKSSNAWGFLPDIVIPKSELTILKPTKKWNAPYNISSLYIKKRFIPQFFFDLEEEIKLQIRS